MAWRSSGTTNDEMVDNLKGFGVVSSPTLEQGFRNVDRIFFVPRGQEHVAHKDQPLKEGNVHISAPHIYGSALEALELKPNSSLSFLNVGSGTGYVSCIVANILGMHSSNYGVEIHEDVVSHSKMAIQRWILDPNRRNKKKGLPPIEIFHGNAFEIDSSKGEALVGFDRIYVGAAVEKRNLSKLTRLLRPGGILVGPVDDELVKVVRIRSNEPFSDGMDTASSDDFSQHVLSGVRFAPLIHYPRREVLLPSRVWEPAAHQYYPDSFRLVCKELLLCSNSDYFQPLPRQETPAARINLAAKLPKAIWIEIMSFTHRSWFEPPQTELAFLRRRLMEEQADAQRAHEARLEAEARLRTAERERDMYSLLAGRWQSRLQVILRQRARANGGDVVGVNDAAAIVLTGREQSAVFGLGNMLHLLQNDEEDNEEDDEGDEGNAMMVEEQQEEAMEEDGDAIHFHEASSGDFFEDSESEDNTEMEGQNSVDEGDAQLMSMSPGTAKAIASRPQVRTVSISSDDL